MSGRIFSTVALVFALFFVVASGVSTAQSDAGWRGEYYNNRYLSGAPALVRQDNTIDFNWGTGSPSAVINSDHFSARWTKDVYFAGGVYAFTTITDDGVRLFVGDYLIIDQWHDMPPTTYTASIDLPEGWYTVRMEYYERGGGAQARLSWQRGEGGKGGALYPDWHGEYFNNTSLSGYPDLERNDEDIDFNWGEGSPDREINADRFSVRWTRDVRFAGGTYEFTTNTDDGVRLYVDDIQIIDQWHDMAPTKHSATINLIDGWHTIRMEYYEHVGGAQATLSWQLSKGGTGGALYPDWHGEYFNNTSLSGYPDLERNDVAIDFDWGNGSPGSEIKADRFSVRWTQDFYFDEGQYRFTTETDDGVRLYIDNKLLIDAWRPMAVTTVVQTTQLSAGVHTLRMEYFEQDGGAVARLWWDSQNPRREWDYGNIITCVPPYPSYSWIKVYRLTRAQTWQDVNPNGWGPIDSQGMIKIDGLPVDYGKYGKTGHPYRVERWVGGKLVDSIGNVYAGEPSFRVLPQGDTHTPWKCPVR